MEAERLRLELVLQLRSLQLHLGLRGATSSNDATMRSGTDTKNMMAFTGDFLRYRRTQFAATTIV